MAMLMLGVGFKLSGDKNRSENRKDPFHTLWCGSGGIIDVLFCSSLPLEYRQTLAVLVFSPIAAAAPAFTGDLKGDIGLASAVNSISIIISMVMITTVLIVVL